MSQHAEYHYSVLIKTDHEGVLHCLRALSAYSQLRGNNRIPWGGTKRKDWERDKHLVTFHFSKPEYRKIFMEVVDQLLPKNLLKKIDEKDNDPARPRS